MYDEFGDGRHDSDLPRVGITEYDAAQREPEHVTVRVVLFLDVHASDDEEAIDRADQVMSDLVFTHSPIWDYDFDVIGVEA